MELVYLTGLVLGRVLCMVQLLELLSSSGVSTLASFIAVLILELLCTGASMALMSTLTELAWELL